MKDTKRRVLLFSFYDHTHIAAYLERQAERGWMLEKIGSLAWRFRRTEPKKLRFAVSYYAPASAYDPEPSEGELDFREFCERTGWKLAASSGQMQVFCNERENAVPIETDPAMEVENIHRAAKKSFLPAQFSWLAIALMNLAVRAWQLSSDPIGALASGPEFFACGCFLALLVISAAEIGAYFRWRARAKKAAGYGEFLPTPDHRPLQRVILILLAAFTLWFVLYERRSWPILAASFLAVALMLSIVSGIQAALRRGKVSAGLNRMVTVISATVLSVAGVLLVTAAIISLDGSRSERYTVFGITFTAYQDELPLTVGDLTGTSDGKYSCSLREDGSPLLARIQGDQTARLDVGLEEVGELPELEYTVLEVRLPFLYGWCRDLLYRERGDDDWEFFQIAYTPTDPAPWRADQAWELWDYEYDRPWNEFLLCYERSIVVIKFGPDWTPTPEQRAIVGEKLGK